MPPNPPAPSFSGILFDLGNTLIPFGRRQTEGVIGALVRFVGEEIPGVDPVAARDALTAAMRLQHRRRMATLEESDPREVIRTAFAALGAVAREDDQVPRGFEAYRAGFLAMVEPGPGMAATLEAVRDAGLPMGLVSNYSHGPAIHDALDRLGIRTYFRSVIVSADFGRIKPHPDIFLAAASRIGVDPEAVLFVGDNPRADVAGASAAGLRTAWVTEHIHDRYVFEDPEENDVPIRPDLLLPRLADLVAHLPGCP